MQEPAAKGKRGRPKHPERLAAEKAAADAAARKPIGPSIAGWPILSSWSVSGGYIRLIATYVEAPPEPAVQP